jgi:N-acetylglucosaminyldiphosphoundecaprenol N-acetyl-beta-D-mannosaminyltransferase
VPPAITDRQRILGQPIDPVSRRGAVKLILERALEGSPGDYVCLTNVHTTVESQRLSSLRAAAEGAYLSVPDGMPLVWILRRRGRLDTEKVTGIELMPMVVRAGRDLGLRHLLYGGRPGVAEAAVRRLEELAPGAFIVGAHSPPFGKPGEQEVQDLGAIIDDARPHVLWVGLGAPKQEVFMARAAGRLSVPVMVGVGAAFDFLAGRKPAAPPWMRHGGLEWLFRLSSEPRRLWRRYVLGNTYFVYLLARQALRRTEREDADDG